MVVAGDCGYLTYKGEELYLKLRTKYPTRVYVHMFKVIRKPRSDHIVPLFARLEMAFSPLH